MQLLKQPRAITRMMQCWSDALSHGSSVRRERSKALGESFGARNRLCWLWFAEAGIVMPNAITAPRMALTGR